MVLHDLADGISKAFQNMTKNLTIDDDVLKEMLESICSSLKDADVQVELVSEVRKNLARRLISDEFKKYSNKRAACKELVWNEICRLLSPGKEAYKLKKGQTNVLMFVGLQGAGKTTTIAKYAHYFKKRKWKVGIVCADTFRAGAFDQLRQNSSKVSVPFYGSYTETDPVKVSCDGIKLFRDDKFELILVDTSGRHRQEKSLFKEMKQIEQAVKPDDIVFIMDGTIGQAAMEQAKAFKNTVKIGSCIITKMDGTKKGGGAIAAVAATRSPITFLGTGEHAKNFEPFNPRGFSSKLLGFGDLQSVLDRLKGDEEKQKKQLINILKGSFTARDLHGHLTTIMKLGPISEVTKQFSPQLAKIVTTTTGNSDTFKKYLTIMDSMTDYELDHPNFIVLQKERSRMERLARGSGCTEQEVTGLFSKYKFFKKTFKTLNKRVNLKELMKNQNDPQAAINMLQGMIPGGARGSANLRRMYQQFTRMGGAPKGMRMKLK